MRSWPLGGLLVGLAVWMGLGAEASAQTRGAAKPPDDLKTLVKAMSGHVRQLAADLAADPKRSDALKARVEEAKELAHSMDDFQSALAPRGEPFRVRQQYSGIDASWHHLVAAVLRSGATPPAIEATLKAAAEADLSIHKALRVREALVYYGMNAPLEGVPEVRRLAVAMVDRAQALAEAVRMEIPGSLEGRLLEEARNLTQAAESYYDTLKHDGQVDAITQNGFAPIEAMTKAFVADLAEVPAAPRTRAAWRSYQAVEALMRQVLAGPVQTAPPPQPLPSTGGVQTVLDLADQLVLEASRYADLFGPTGNGIDEGPEFLNDARSLQIAAANFRREVAANPKAAFLAFKFRDIDIIWLRLARRTNRIGRGRAGFEMGRVARMGEIVAELHRVLGIPGYPAGVSGVP